MYGADDLRQAGGPGLGYDGYMAGEDIKSTISELRQRLEQADPVDPETRQLLGQLDQDLHRLLESPVSETGEAGLQERLETLAADFDARNPQLAAILRELGVALSRVGI